MFRKLNEFWEEKGFEIVFWGSIIIIIICIVFRIRSKAGTYDKNIWSYPDMFSRKTLIDLPTSQPAPKSRDSKGETACRNYLEMRFKKPFGKIRPKFLRNQVTSDGGTDYNLELDCYNDELKLALEYNGAQHYKYIPHFHRSKEAFHNQKYRDEIKKYKCKENGIRLIEVPYNVKNIENFIEQELRNFGH
jgi:hypothetical protein